MIKYWLSPILYFVFGILVFALETFIFNSMSNVPIDARRFTNDLNQVLFILTPIILGFFIVLPGVRKLKTLGYKVIFTVFSVVLHVLISYFWITIIVWK